ncbi:MAG: sulfopyruvate decarboxylase subunit beta [Acidiferrobacteraceae bacterium]|nr:sulfopyruvate decarboxylase subunit beta [Acidiferrobacteraceae bacterium]|tara:strand:- start:131 stop:685 length:555 start_codon:yes stop_codon:yes gene_type:complete
MNRYQLIESLVPILEDTLVICNIGIPSQELFSICDRDNHFYMLGSMGLCSSIGLGLSLTTKKSVIALEGDGSVLMNLGSLATIANRSPENFVLIIMDNGSYGSTGDQATYTSESTSLAMIARGAGCDNVIECSGIDTKELLGDVLQQRVPSVIVSKIDPGSQPLPVIPLHPIILRERFRSSIKS